MTQNRPEEARKASDDQRWAECHKHYAIIAREARRVAREDYYDWTTSSLTNGNPLDTMPVFVYGMTAKYHHHAECNKLMKALGHDVNLSSEAYLWNAHYAMALYALVFGQELT